MAVVGLVYGIFAYLLFLASILYAIGFVGNLFVPKSIDLGGATQLSTAIVIDVLLLSLFAIQHSVMARPAFKRAWTRIVPPFLERSTYVLGSDLVLIVLFWQWRAVPAPVWNVQSSTFATLLRVIFFAGWALLVAATFMIDHFDLFGLRQVWFSYRRVNYTPPPFGTNWAYRYLRHPIMLGFLIAFWATPVMSLGHLLFAAGSTGYILIAIRLEEHDLVGSIGEAYKAYRRRVPMLLPRLR